MQISNTKKIMLATLFGSLTGIANAGYEVKLSDNDKLTLGGYIKLDARYVNGDVAYRDFWIGAGAPLAESASLAWQYHSAIA